VFGGRRGRQCVFRWKQDFFQWKQYFFSRYGTYVISVLINEDKHHVSSRLGPDGATAGE